MLHAGQRQDLVIVERETITSNGLNEQVSSWARYARGYARVSWGSGSERIEAARQAAVQAATFTVLATTKMRSVTPADRLVHAGVPWNIVAVSLIGREEVALTCQRKVG